MLKISNTLSEVNYWIFETFKILELVLLWIQLLCFPFLLPLKWLAFLYSCLIYLRTFTQVDANLFSHQVCEGSECGQAWILSSAKQIWDHVAGNFDMLIWILYLELRAYLGKYLFHFHCLLIIVWVQKTNLYF